MMGCLMPPFWKIVVPFIIAAILVVFYALWRFAPEVEIRPAPTKECQRGNE